MQQNIDFGSFPNDPDADAIRSAFQKTQENFTELFQTQTGNGVLSINQIPQPGITLTSSPTGNVTFQATFDKLTVQTTSLQVGLTANSGGLVTSINSGAQSLFVDLRPNTNIINNLTVGGYSINSVDASVTASGTNQATATNLTKAINVVTNAASTAGVKLPTAIAGMSITITNTTGNVIWVYPQTSSSINREPTNGYFQQAIFNTTQFIAISSTKWYTVGDN